MFHTGIECFDSEMKRTMSRARDDRKADRDDLLGEVMLAVRSFTNAQDVFDDAAVDVLGINRSDGRCLDILDQSGPLAAGELARRAHLSTAAITALVDRMERAGYLTRVRDTVDRRRVVIAGTEQARYRCATIWGPIEQDGVAFLNGFTDDQLHVVRRFMDGGREVLLAHLDRIKSLAPRIDADETVVAVPSPAESGTIPA